MTPAELANAAVCRDAQKAADRLTQCSDECCAYLPEGDPVTPQPCPCGCAINHEAEISRLLDALQAAEDRALAAESAAEAYRQRAERSEATCCTCCDVAKAKLAAVEAALTEADEGSPDSWGVHYIYTAILRRRMAGASC